MTEKHTCDGCGKEFDSKRGLSLHQTRMDGELVHNRFALLDSYLFKQQTQREVAEELDTSRQAVIEYVDRFDVHKDHSQVMVEMWQNQPLHFGTGTHGYEVVSNTYRGDTSAVKHHRLLAVAEHGYEQVADMDVNHIIPIPWLNIPSNVETLSHSEHGRLHAQEQHGNRKPRWKRQKVSSILWGGSGAQ